MPQDVGGRTVFPDYGFAQTPSEGTALFYRSQEDLVHYSEAIIPKHHHPTTKWILQLLLDFDHEYQPGDCIIDFRTGESFVWDGRQSNDDS